MTTLLVIEFFVLIEEVLLVLVGASGLLKTLRVKQIQSRKFKENFL